MNKSEIVHKLQRAIKLQRKVRSYEKIISRSVLQYVDIDDFYNLPFSNILNIIKEGVFENDEESADILCKIISKINNMYPKECVLLLNALPSFFDEDASIKIMGAFTHSAFLTSYVEKQIEKQKLPIIDYDCMIEMEKNKVEEIMKKIDPFESASEGRLDSLKLMIQKGFDIKTRDSKQRTVLHYAAMGGHIDIVKYLVEDCQCDVDPLDYEGKTPLLRTVKFGHRDVISFLHSHGANLVKPSQTGWYPIHAAAKWGHYEIIDYLLINGVNIELAEGRDQRTPLYIACQFGNRDAVIFLINHGANPYAATGREGFTPLHIASFRNYAEIVELLLTVGVDVNIQSKSHKTPLDSANMGNSIDVAKIIMKKGGVSFRKPYNAGINTNYLFPL